MESFPVAFWKFLVGELCVHGYMSLILRYFTQQSEKGRREQAWPGHLTLQLGADLKLGSKTRETVHPGENDSL